jgi:hypothetical protein
MIDLCRMRKGLVAALLATIAAGASARADPPAPAGPLTATMVCPRVAAPGRVRCEVTAQVGAGESIPWGEVVIVQTTPPLTALRGRVGPGDAVKREGSAWTWAFAIAAPKTGTGEVVADVRVVACKDKVCAPRKTTVKGRVDVGVDASPAPSSSAGSPASSGPGN